MKFFNEKLCLFLKQYMRKEKKRSEFLNFFTWRIPNFDVLQLRGNFEAEIVTNWFCKEHSAPLMLPLNASQKLR